MEFTKIKYDRKTVELVWHTGNLNGTVTEHHLKSTEKPSPNFIRALDAFLEPTEVLLKIKAVDEDFYFDTVRGISLGWQNENDDDLRWIVVTLAKALTINGDNAELIVNMPKCRLLGRLDTLVNEMEDHAERFGNGARAQGDLFVPDDDTSVVATISGGPDA